MTDAPDPSHADFEQTLSAMLDRPLDAEQMRQLNDHVERGDDLQTYLDWIVLNTFLRREIGSMPLRPPITPTIHHPPFRIRWMLAAVAAMALAASISMIFLFHSEPRTSNPELASTPAASVATVTNLDHAVFAPAPGTIPPKPRAQAPEAPDSPDSPQLGSPLAPGPIRLKSGTAQIMFNSTAVVDLTGPCEFQMTDANRGRLIAGLIHAFVPKKARGFTVDLPDHSRIVDLGTEFDVSLAPGSSSGIYVWRGHVAFNRPAPDQPVILQAGQLLITHPNSDGAGSTATHIELPPACTPVDYYDFNPISVARSGQTVSALAAFGQTALRVIGQPNVGTVVDDQPCVHFDQSGQRLETTAPPVRLDNDWIIRLKVRPETVQGRAAVCYLGQSSANGLGLYRIEDHWAIVLGGTAIVPIGRVTLNRWTTLSIEWVDGHLRAAVGDATHPVLLSPAPLNAQAVFSVGGEPGHDDETFIGSISRLRVLRYHRDVNPSPTELTR